MSTPTSEQSTTTPRRIAIIGGGISGLSAAWHLHTTASSTNSTITLFESSSTLGGHANTITPPPGISPPVDIGFMVFNHQNYPNMTSLFSTIGVPIEDSDMSLCISLDDGLVEWNSGGRGVLRHLWRAVPSILRFHDEALEILSLAEDDPRKRVTVGEWLRQKGYGDEFGRYYLLPMMGALWSASLGNVLEFPMVQLVEFLGNHKMLQIFDRPQWKTVKGRSQSYTKKLEEILSSNIRVSTPIKSMKKIRTSSTSPAVEYELFTTGEDSVGTFDDIIFACHTNTAHSILSTNSKEDNDSSSESITELLQLLSKIEYADNEMYLHSDPNLMPRQRDNWSSWNCIGKKDSLEWKSSTKSSNRMMEGSESGFGATLPSPNSTTTRQPMSECYVTYYLNKLQNLPPSSHDMFLSLNPHTPPSPDKLLGTYTMAHPQFTPSSLIARQCIQKNHQGTEGLWFCGAYMGYGFHEDGCRSGLEVATSITGLKVPWVNPMDECRVSPPPDISKTIKQKQSHVSWTSIYQFLTNRLPVIVCQRLMHAFLRRAITTGVLEICDNDGNATSFGASNPENNGNDIVTMRVFDDWFFVKICLEYDLGLARAYMSGMFNILPPRSASSTSYYDYDTLYKPSEASETNLVLGDPVGLTRLFLLLIKNRDEQSSSSPKWRKQISSARVNSGPLTTASGLLLSKLGSFYNFLIFKLFMRNTEHGGSMGNIHAHYDISNELFKVFLDNDTMMYSSAIYDTKDVAVALPQAPHTASMTNASTGGSMSCRAERRMLSGTLEEAQRRKLATLLHHAGIHPPSSSSSSREQQTTGSLTVLDIGFGWGGLSILAAQNPSVSHVVGVTLSKEQMAYATEKVKSLNLEHKITYEVIDYRTFARKEENYKKFDVVLSCEMIEAVGHENLGDYFACVERVLKDGGTFVMEAITTPERRYEAYKGSTDFINTIIFPGSCCPSLHALVDASYKQSTLTLQHITNINLHYAETLREWRRRFNAHSEWVKKYLGFDDVFLRTWNYYLTYCEAGFYSRTENCLILKFSHIDGVLRV